MYFISNTKFCFELNNTHSILEMMITNQIRQLPSPCLNVWFPFDYFFISSNNYTDYAVLFLPIIFLFPQINMLTALILWRNIPIVFLYTQINILTTVLILSIYILIFFLNLQKNKWLFFHLLTLILFCQSLQTFNKQLVKINLQKPQHDNLG